MSNDKIQDKNASKLQDESNAERDQDAGNMNNGTLGGNMGVIGNSNEESDNAEPKKGEDDKR